MRYIFDNDLHIHSRLSLCSGDPEQNVNTILDYAVRERLSRICVTDHFWDADVPGASEWYKKQDYEHIKKSLPLPEANGVRFMFGCETELDMHMTLGISREKFDAFDFIIIPTTHLHMNGFTCRGDESAKERAELWVRRFDAVLGMDLPFYKVGIAHLTCSLMYKQDHDSVLRLIPESEMERLFSRAAKLGVGIELNIPSWRLGVEPGWDTETNLKPYRIAKAQGCKFYFGSDAHHPAELLREKENAERIIGLLELDESEKFVL